MSSKYLLQNINQGGIADSNYLGGKNSVADMLGLDIHSEPGVIKVNAAMSLDSASTIDGFIQAVVSCSDGNSYFFSADSGKVWSRDIFGVYTLVATISNGNDNRTLGAMEYKGWIYYATSNIIGRWQLGTAWSTRNDNYATFTNGSTGLSITPFHPMQIVNAVLYIGDQNLVAQVDTGTFSASALDVSTPYLIKCLGQLGTDLLVGTYTSSSVVAAQIFRWNTWSISFTNSDPIPEVGLNAFLVLDNNILVHAGTKGNIYLYDGVQLKPYKKMKGTWTSTNKITMFPQACINFNGLAYFGISTNVGSPLNIATYSLGRANTSYPYVLNCDFGISTGNFSNISIGAIIPYADYFLVTWRDLNTGTYGVDKYNDSTRYGGSYLTTRVFTADRFMNVNYGVARVGYRNLPSGTGFTFYTNLNNAGFNVVATGDVVVDTQRHEVRTKINIGDANTVQVKVVPILNAGVAPDIEAVQVDIDAEE